jgi:hypothetical protein
MRSRWLVNLFLLVLAVGLAALIQLTEHGETQAGRLTPLEPDTIEQVRLERADADPIILRRSETGWQMTSPYPVTADPAQLHRLLPIAAAANQRSIPIAGVDLTELGLDPPLVRLWLDDVLLEIGGTEPIAALRYVRVGDLIHLIDDRFIGRLLAPPEDYIGKTLLPPDFSPGIGSLNGEPLSADELAVLADARAERVEPLGQALSGIMLEVQSADAADSLRFLVADDGRRWSRLDLRLSWLFRASPLPRLEPTPTTATDAATGIGGAGQP